MQVVGGGHGTWGQDMGIETQWMPMQDMEGEEKLGIKGGVGLWWPQDMEVRRGWEGRQRGHPLTTVQVAPRGHWVSLQEGR